MLFLFHPPRHKHCMLHIHTHLHKPNTRRKDSREGGAELNSELRPQRMTVSSWGRRGVFPVYIFASHLSSLELRNPTTFQGHWVWAKRNRKEAHLVIKDKGVAKYHRNYLCRSHSLHWRTTQKLLAPPCYRSSDLYFVRHWSTSIWQTQRRSNKSQGINPSHV